MNIVVSFTLSLPSESRLVSLKVALILANFHKPHSEEEKLTIAVPHRHGGLVALIGERLESRVPTHLKLALPSKSILFYNDLLNIPFLPYHLAYIFILISALIFKQYC